MELVRCTERGGIPQGPTASSILGNFYLLPVDQKFADAGLEFFRYQDDIKIFADSSQNLRHLLTHILRLLRARRLSLSVHKTKLLHGDKILAEFEDAEKDAISYGLKIKSPVVKDRLRAFFDKAVSQPTISARDVRFAITRLSDLNDPHAVSWILGHLSEVPYLAAQLVEYLGGWVDSTPEIEKNTREFLEDPFDNIYPFTELHLIRMLCRATSLSTQTMSTIWRVLSDKNKENFVREHAARCIGRHPRAGDVARLRNELAYATDDRIRRALLVAICEAAPIDKAWLGSIAVTHPKLRATCAFLGTGAKIPAP